MTGFKGGDIAINDFNQKVKIIDIVNSDIVFKWIDENKIETLNDEKFDSIFTKAKNVK